MVHPSVSSTASANRSAAQNHPRVVTVLMLGQHLELGHYRTEFLSSHGVGVIFPETKDAAFEAIRSGGFDVVILSYSLSDDTAKELIELLDQVNPGCPLISISEQRWYDREFKPDATILASDPPQALLDAIHRVQSQRRSALRRVK
jgi:DNA-binding NtrC family response regulator